MFGKYEKSASWARAPGTVVACGLLLQTHIAHAETDALKVWSVWDDPAIFSGFEEAHGIGIQVMTLQADELSISLLASAMVGSGDVDVVLGMPGPTLEELAEHGLVARLEFPLPSLVGRLSDWREVPRWVALDASPIVICMNRNAARDYGRPTDWLDLAVPRYKATLAIPDPRRSASGYALLSAWLDRFSAFGTLGFSGVRGGWEIIDRINNNVLVYTRTPWEPCELAAAGKVQFGISTLSVGAEILAKKGAIELLIPESGTPVTVLGAAIMENAPNKEGSQDFLRWLTADRTRFLLGALREGATTVRIGDSLETLDATSYWSVINRAARLLAPPRLASERRDILAEWSARYDAKAQR